MQPSDLASKAYFCAPGPGIFTQFSIPMAYAYTPLHLTPTPTYFQVIERTNSISDDITRAKLPAKVTLPGFGDAQVGLKFRVYPPGMAALTATFVADIDEEHIDCLFELRSLPRAEPLLTLFKTSISLIEAQDHRELVDPPRWQSYTAINIRLPTPDFNAKEFWESNRAKFTGLIIGNHEYAGISPDISTHLAQKSLEFNKKSTNRLLVADKQGSLLISSMDDRRRNFQKAIDLVEIALVMKQFLDNYLALRLDAEEFCDFLYLRIRAWVYSPEALFSASVSNRFYWNHLIVEFSLRRTIELIEHDNRWLELHLQESSRYFATVSTSWWDQPTFAESLALDGAGRRHSLLHSISDAELRSSIVRDISEADRNLASRNFKSALVMAGSAAEALLLAILIERTSLNRATLLNENFSQYIQHVKNENLNVDAATLAVMDNTLRQWRNLVHPGRQLRLNVTIDEHKANVAISALHALVAEVDK